jgi:hypothetical protein
VLPLSEQTPFVVEGSTRSVTGSPDEAVRVKTSDPFTVPADGAEKLIVCDAFVMAVSALAAATTL